MATFNMQGQQVGTQNIAGRDMFIGAVQTRVDFAAQLDALSTDLAQAHRDGEIEDAPAAEAKEALALAAAEARTDAPDKGRLLTSLDTAKKAVKDVVAVAGLYEALTKLPEIVHRLF